MAFCLLCSRRQHAPLPISLAGEFPAFPFFTDSLQAAIYFKNCVTKRWCLQTSEKDPDNPSIVLYEPVNEAEKVEIRKASMQLLATIENVIALQLVESMPILFGMSNRPGANRSRGVLYQVAIHDARRRCLLQWKWHQRIAQIPERHRRNLQQAGDRSWQWHRNHAVLVWLKRSATSWFTSSKTSTNSSLTAGRVWPPFFPKWPVWVDQKGLNE